MCAKLLISFAIAGSPAKLSAQLSPVAVQMLESRLMSQVDGIADKLAELAARPPAYASRQTSDEDHSLESESASVGNNAGAHGQGARGSNEDGKDDRQSAYERMQVCFAFCT